MVPPRCTQFRHGEAQLKVDEFTAFSFTSNFITDVLKTARSLRSEEDCSFQGITKEQCRHKGCVWKEAGPTCLKTDIKNNIIDKYGTHLLKKFTVGCYSSYKLKQDKKFFQDAKTSVHNTNSQLDMEVAGYKAGFNKRTKDTASEGKQKTIGLVASDGHSSGSGCSSGDNKWISGCVNDVGSKVVLAKDEYYAISELIGSAMKMDQLKVMANEIGDLNVFDPDLLQDLEQDHIMALSTEMEHIVTELLSVEYERCNTAGSTFDQWGICIVDKISGHCPLDKSGKQKCLCYDVDDYDVDDPDGHMPGQKKSSCRPVWSAWREAGFTKSFSEEDGWSDETYYGGSKDLGAITGMQCTGAIATT